MKTLIIVTIFILSGGCLLQAQNNPGDKSYSWHLQKSIQGTGITPLSGSYMLACQGNHFRYYGGLRVQYDDLIYGIEAFKNTRLIGKFSDRLGLDGGITFFPNGRTNSRWKLYFDLNNQIYAYSAGYVDDFYNKTINGSHFIWEINVGAGFEYHPFDFLFIGLRTGIGGTVDNYKLFNEPSGRDILGDTRLLKLEIGYRLK